MTLTADDVLSQVFRQELRGYHRGDVDAFLDRVVDRLRELESAPEVAPATAAGAPAAQDAADGVEESQPVPVVEDASDADGHRASAAAQTPFVDDNDLLRRTLLLAQRTADQTQADAERDADRVRAEAAEAAEAVRREAQADAERHVADARARLGAELADTRNRLVADARAVAQARVDFERQAGHLRQFRDTFVGDVRRLVAAELAALESLPDTDGMPGAPVLSPEATAAVEAATTSADGDDTADRVTAVEAAAEAATAGAHPESVLGGDPDRREPTDADGDILPTAPRAGGTRPG